mgnify:CR=1 FL=1
MSPSSDLAAQYVQVEVASPDDQQFIVYTEWKEATKTVIDISIETTVIYYMKNLSYNKRSSQSSSMENENKTP